MISLFVIMIVMFLLGTNPGLGILLLLNLL